jgi:Domain of unknown function (DUF1844)
MASEEEGSKSFKVQDRRRFSAEGELKPEFSGADESSAKPETPHPSAAHSAGASAVSPPQQAEAPAPQVASQPQQAAAAQGYAAARAAAGSEIHPAAGAAEITFATFLMSLSTEALVHLGEMADPAGGQPQRDLTMAQQMIDILGMLRDKTRGNLGHDEQALLDAILFDLRMKYVEIARRND